MKNDDQVEVVGYTMVLKPRLQRGRREYNNRRVCADDHFYTRKRTLRDRFCSLGAFSHISGLCAVLESFTLVLNLVTVICSAYQRV